MTLIDLENYTRHNKEANKIIVKNIHPRRTSKE